MSRVTEIRDVGYVFDGFDPERKVCAEDRGLVEGASADWFGQPPCDLTSA